MGKKSGKDEAKRVSELTSKIATLLLEAAKTLYEKGELRPLQDAAVVVVPYLRERPDGVVVTVNSLALFERRRHE